MGEGEGVGGVGGGKTEAAEQPAKCRRQVRVVQPEVEL